MLAITFPALCFGITEYQPGDKLFIWAVSGLNLREASDPQSKVLTKIPFAGKVICQSEKSWNSYLDNPQTIKHHTATFGGNPVEIKLKGEWVKVKFGDYEGYVFDTYLSRFQPPMASDEQQGLIEYLTAACDSVIYLEKRTRESGRDKILFSNGIYMTHNYHSSGSWFQMILPDFSIEEAFLIIRYLDKYAHEINQKEDGEIWIGQELGGYTIESYKNIVIISGDWAC